MTLDLREFVEDLAKDDDLEKSVIDRVEYRVHKLGIGPAEPLIRNGKQHNPKLPSKGVTNLTDEQVTDLQADFVTMMTYAGEQAGIQDTMATVYGVEAKRMKARVRLKATGTSQEKEDKATIHPKVMALEDKALVAQQTYKRLKEYREGYEKARGVCSRDVVRRQGDFDADRRDNSIRSKRRRSRGPIRQSELEPGGRRDR